MFSGNKAKKSVTVSFRVNEDSYRALQEDAAHHNISINTLVNQLFASYANLDRYFDKIGFFKISKPTFTRVLNAASEKELIEAARLSGADTAKIFALERYGTLSLGTVLDFLRAVSEYGNFTGYNEVKNPQGKRVITLTHGYGEKGSLFIEHYVRSILEAIDARPAMTSTEHSVVIEI